MVSGSKPLSDDALSADVLHPLAGSSCWWTTTNFGEAVPGVLTAMNWSFWSEIGERAARQVFHTLGVLDEDELPVPDDGDERVLGVFRGRIAGNVSLIGRMGDRIPGSSGPDAAASLLGAVPEGFPSNPTNRYALQVVRRMPRTFLSLPRRVQAVHDATDAWWREEVARPVDGLEDARAQFRRAQSRFARALYLQILNNFAASTPVFDAVKALAEKAGDPELTGALLGGQGSHAELALVEDLWRTSRGGMDVDAFVLRHGFHGPMEGEISSRVWREDHGPVLALAEAYGRRGDDEAPDALLGRRAAEREAAERRLLAALGPAQRPAAKLVLHLAAKVNPTRGLGKAAFLQSLDVARMASRTAGRALVASGALADPDDVHHLTAHELLTVDPRASLAELVTARKAQRAAHQAVVLPGSWFGVPEGEPAPTATASAAGVVLEGLGVSPGVVEAPVRVVADPAFDDVEDGEVLVAPFTDPSWASIMYCASALVVEVGGDLSHAAVVARELGVPCVMGVERATTRLQTGDVVRVDGQAGTVEVVSSTA